LSVEVEGDSIRLSLFTWGSFRRGYADIVYPERVSLASIGSRRGVYKAEFPFAEVTVDVQDSSRNMRRTVTVKPRSLVIVRYYGAHSASYAFNEVYVLRPGAEPERADVVVKVVKEPSGKYVVEKHVHTITLEGRELPVHVEVRDKVKVKFDVEVEEKGGKILVKGDTWEIKDRLKTQGFKWDPGARAWYATGMSVSEVVEALKVIEGVNIVNVKRGAEERELADATVG